MANEELIFAKRPSGLPDASTFQLQSCTVRTPRTGQVLVRATYFSVDPYMRGRLSEAKSYAAGWKLGEPGMGGCAGVVLESNAKGFAPGDVVVGQGLWQRLFVADAANLRKIKPTEAVPESAYLGMLGGAGLSAYFPLKEIGKPMPGETVFVSGAAGAVGMVVGQICKIKGARVVGSAGTDEKVAFLKTIGFDEVFNYKNEHVGQALDRFCPEGIDVYWDNVGGETLDAALERMKTYGRIVACGAISQYNKNSNEIYGLKNYMNVVKFQLKYQGFIVSQWADRFEEGRQQLAAWCESGHVKLQDTVVHGFANIPVAFAGLFNGENLGKMVVKVEESDSLRAKL